MSFFVGLLTFVLVLNCLFLILLVLVQLPKKDAGAGMAFGGGTADALFGAGSGNALTKITKWTAGIFLALAVVLGLLQPGSHADTASAFTTLVEQKQQQTSVAPPASTANKPKAEVATPAGNGLLSATIPAVTNAAVRAVTAATNSAK